MATTTALVTGASRGIGRATAVRLAAAGYDVIVAARTLVDGTARLDGGDTVLAGGLDTTAAMIRHAGGQAHAVALDLTDPASVDRALDEIEAITPRLDVLVNNGIYQGPAAMSRFVDSTDEDIRLVLEGNLHSQLRIIRRVLPAMLQHGAGTIVNLVSQAGFITPPAPIGAGGWSLAYALSKAAFGRVAPLLHVEHGPAGLRAFSIEPGLTITERMELAGRADLYRQHYDAFEPDTIARIIAWLVTDPAADEWRGRLVHAGEVAATLPADPA